MKTTMQDIANYYNESEEINTSKLEGMIEEAGFISDCDTEFGICHNDTEKVVINDEGQAVVVPMEDSERKNYMESLSEYERELMIDTDSFGRDTSEKYGYTSSRTSTLRCIEDALVSYADDKMGIDEFDAEMARFESSWEEITESFEKPLTCKLNISLDFIALVKQAADGIEWDGSNNSREDLEAQSIYF